MNIPLVSLIEVLAALKAVVHAPVSDAVPFPLWKQCMDAKCTLEWRVESMIAGASTIEVAA